jgi:hypothetical protein
VARATVVGGGEACGKELEEVTIVEVEGDDRAVGGNSKYLGEQSTGMGEYI